MKFQPLKQRKETDCGPTSIRMIAAYFSVLPASHELARLSHTARADGLSNNNLVVAFRRLGLTADSRYNASWADLIASNTPAHAIVVSWMLDGYIGHFSVVDKVSKTAIFLADPHKGAIIRFPKLVFLRLWFDYDGLWYPRTASDIRLRWMTVVSRSGVDHHVSRRRLVPR
jgi:ABC-type bacteriocin/lantibiotic exporter with double-glycine peptidase domain